MPEEEKEPIQQDLAGDGLGDGAREAGAPGTTAGAAELDRARAEVAELTNRLFKAQAEYENYRRRMAKEREELAQYANQKLVISLLPVLDNLERALAAPPTAGDEKLRQGVELTARSFRDLLAREGVVPVEAVGQPFDPNLHEAVMTVELEEHDDDIVVAEFQKGYKLADRVIRPSGVQVNKKG